ncbi:DUF2281 domain-containing protein [Dyadobacter sp. 3J3]|uniref:DUF2281 domain-containing protein n=1 Tax=Dyadobacter sp. 3J3 TaxID=2606600 RepID=UPI00135767F8|nr:DUF2281 domain-containing protein [Dyadobacter sp. 3J3]
MLTTIEGVYENGQVILTENAPLRKKTKVLITFMDEVEPNVILEKRPLGTMKGTITMSEDFNNSLDDLKDYM